MIILGSIAAAAFFGCAMYGFGTITRGLVGLPPGTWPVTTAVGLAAWLVAGGPLTLAGISYPWVIYLLLALGSAVTFRSLFACGLSSAVARATGGVRSSNVYQVTSAIVAVAIIGFAAVTQIAPSAFNHSDDYQKYFAHVARLLQTGSLQGSPLNALGSETLGGQAYLHAAFISYLPFSAINVADAVFCFSLIALMIRGVAVGRASIAPVAISAMLFVWVVEPQYVNVSALYSAAALVFATVVLSVDRREYAADDNQGSPPLMMGLFYAALTALKPTFALFISLHFVFCGIAEVFSTRRVAEPIKRMLAIAGWGIVFIVPWIATYFPLYWTGLTAPAPSLRNFVQPAVEEINFLATNALFYGGSYAKYTFAIGVVFICSMIVLFRYRRPPPDAARLLGICFALGATYFGIVLVGGPLLAGYETALRYFLPVLIGGVPAVLVYCGWMVAANRVQSRNRAGWFTAGLASLLVLSFLPDLWVRFEVWSRTGSMLAYLRSLDADQIAAFLTFNREILDEARAEQVKEMQERVPEGEPLLVWTSAPFLMNFSRNPIVDADIAGLSNPWSKTPPVRYVLWQYGGIEIRQPQDYVAQMQGPGVRETNIAARGFAYARQLQQLMTSSRPLMNDGKTVLLRLPEGASLP